jgi:hypothetical protein
MMKNREGRSKQKMKHKRNEGRKQKETTGRGMNSGTFQERALQVSRRYPQFPLPLIPSIHLKYIVWKPLVPYHIALTSAINKIPTYKVRIEVE